MAWSGSGVPSASDEERHGRGGIAHAGEGRLRARQRVEGGERLVRVVEAAPRGDLGAPLALHLLVGEQRQLRVERRRAGGGPEEPGEERARPARGGRPARPRTRSTSA